jgi:putative membrane protein
LFLAVAVVSVKPTMTFIRWKRMYERDAAWQVPGDEQAAMRKLVMVEVHLAALIPVFAVIMSRGLGH